MNDKTQKFDLVINGGGLAGASLAAALRGSGRRIALIEGLEPTAPAADGRRDNRVYALSPASLRFLRQLGIDSVLDRSHLAPVYDMKIAGDGSGSIHFSAYECGVEVLSHIAESSRLTHALWQTLAGQAGLTLFSPARPATLDAGTASSPTAALTLEDGRRLEAPLIVGADGRDSWTRRSAGLRAEMHPYEELGVVANFACDKPHRGTAWQWFRDDGVLAWLPLPGPAISVVWSAPLERAKALLALSPQALAAEVAAAGGYRLGELTALSPAAGFPLKLITVPEIVAPHLALIGDAAHGIHPLSGHGINLGFADAATLARQIRHAPIDQPLGELGFLRRFARARRVETVLLQQGTHALHQLFANRPPELPGLLTLPRLPVPPGLRMLRNLGLDLTDRISPVKSWLARVAMG